MAESVLISKGTSRNSSRRNIAHAQKHTSPEVTCPDLSGWFGRRAQQALPSAVWWKWWRRKLRVCEPPGVCLLPSLKAEPGLRFFSPNDGSQILSPALGSWPRGSPTSPIHVLLMPVASGTLGMEKGKKKNPYIPRSGRRTDIETCHCTLYVLWQRGVQRLGA